MKKDDIGLYHRGHNLPVYIQKLNYTTFLKLRWIIIRYTRYLYVSIL